MDTYGELRTSEVARLLGVDQTQAETELEAFAFVDPDTVKHTEDGWTAAWVPRADFLSGNVRARLTRVGEVLEQLVETATATATGDETAQLMVRRLQAAETALTEVLPAVPKLSAGPRWVVACITSRSSNAMPSSSAATWAIEVCTPCPISTLGIKTRTRLSSSTSNQLHGVVS